MRFLPKGFKRWAKAHVAFETLDRQDWERKYALVLAQARRSPPATDLRVSIVHDWMLRHVYYEAACLELGVPYDVVDLTTPDWVEKAANDRSNVFFFRPFVMSTLGRALYEERAYFLTNFLKKNLFPNFDALWLYESKRRCANYLQYYSIPHPKTWVFFSRSEALEFVARASFPLVFKTDIGSDAVGVAHIAQPKGRRPNDLSVFR